HKMLARVRSICFSQEMAGVGWRFASVFVFEIGVHIHALAEPGVEAFPPGRDLLRGVILQAQTGIGKAGGEDVWRSLLVGLGQAQSRFVLAENGVGFVGAPGRVADLEGESESVRAKSKKVLEQRTVEFEI